MTMECQAGIARLLNLVASIALLTASACSSESVAPNPANSAIESSHVSTSSTPEGGSDDSSLDTAALCLRFSAASIAKALGAGEAAVLPDAEDECSWHLTEGVRTDLGMSGDSQYEEVTITLNAYSAESEYGIGTKIFSVPDAGALVSAYVSSSSDARPLPGEPPAVHTGPGGAAVAMPGRVWLHVQLFQCADDMCGGAADRAARLLAIELGPI